MADAGVLTNNAGLNSMLASNTSDTDYKKPVSDATYRKNIAGTIDDTKKAMKDLDELKSARPPVLKPAPSESDYQTDPMKKFGSAGMMLATLGSLLTRKPLTSALNSGAQVMNSINAGDATAFKTAYEKWKGDNENAWRMADWEQSNIKDLAQKAKDKVQGAEQEARLMGIETKNPALERAAQMGQLQDYADAHAKAIRDGKEAQEKIDLKHDLLAGAIDEYTQQHGKPPSQSEMAQMHLMADKQVVSKISPAGAASNPMDSETIDRLVDQYITTGNPQILTTAVRGRGANAATMLADLENRATKRMKEQGVSPQDITKRSIQLRGELAEASKVGNISGAIESAANSLDQSLPVLEDAIKNVDMTRFSDLNAWDNYANRHTGDPDIVALDTALQATKSDYSTLIARNGVRSVETDKKADDLVNSAFAKKQFDSFIKQVRKEKDAQLKATKISQDSVGNWRSGIAGTPPDADHIKMLQDDPTDEMKAYFDEAFGKGAADKVLSK